MCAKQSDEYCFREEYVSVNGISEYLLHYPAGPDAPVILQIHGGPGAPEVSCYIDCGQMYCFYENEKRADSFLKNTIHLCWAACAAHR